MPTSFLRAVILALLLSFWVGSALAQDGTIVKAYPCPSGTARSVANILQTEYGNTAGVRIACDERTSQVIVCASPQLQARIVQKLSTLHSGGAMAPQQQVLQSTVPNTVPGNANQHLAIPLRYCAPEYLTAALADIMGERLAALPPTQAETARYRVLLGSGENVDFVIDVPLRRVIVEGPADAVDECARLIQAVDDTTRPDGLTTRLRQLRTDRPASVFRAVSALSNTTDSHRPFASPASATNQQQGQTGEQFSTVASSTTPARGTAADSQPRVGLISPVKIETIDGLDVLVLRGNSQDVEQVMKIIDEIEQLSAETEPAVEVYNLQHAGCVAVGELLRSVYDEIYLPRQGMVNITPIVTPNALLIVGRRENVQTIINLTKTLDQPVAPDAQFKVFPLRYAAAAVARETIVDFYESRGGLGPQIRVTADIRGNALLVQASPRDMNELAALVARIDTSRSAAVNELRVIQLQHSLAADLAAIVQAAIGSATGAGRAGRQPSSNQPPGPQTTSPGNQPPAQPRSAAQNEQRSAMLRFLSIDAKGRRLVESGILDNVRVTADARGNAVIVSAPPDSIELIEALIHQLDALPAAESQIKVFTIVNGDAEGLKDMLGTLFATQAAAGGQPSGGAATAPAGTGAALVPLRFAVDPRTNSIIASGSMADLSVVEAILLRLDDSDVSQRKTEVFRLKNSDAQYVAEAVNQFLTKERQMQMQQETRGMTSAFEQIEREVVVVPEQFSNSLILSATPRFFKEVKRVIEQLDERPPMVMIQVLIAQVNLRNTEEFGVELGLQDSLLFDRSLLSNPLWQTTTLTNLTSTQTTETLVAADNEPGFNFNSIEPLGNSGATSSTNRGSLVGGQGISNFGVGRSGDLGYGGLVLSASSESVSVLIRALSACERLEVLQRPQIMTLDNQSAFIQVGQDVPIVNNTSLTNYGQNFNTQMVKVGVVLEVTPRISPDGLIVMDIYAEKSKVAPESEGTPIAISEGQVVRSPRIDRIYTQTKVSALSGQTVILGGLITKNDEEFHRKVPCLGDIPILGHLFRYDGVDTKRMELIFIMTPYLVRNECEADAIKQAEAAKMSWCMCDVVEIHGDVGLRGRCDDWSDSETQVVYPDMEFAPVPDGENGLPEMVPVPQGVPMEPSIPEVQPQVEPLSPLVPPPTAQSAVHRKATTAPTPSTATYQ